MKWTSKTVADWMKQIDYFNAHPEEVEMYEPRSTRTADDGATTDEDHMPNPRVSLHDDRSDASDANPWPPDPFYTAFIASLPKEDARPTAVALDAEGQPIDPALGRDRYLEQLRDNWKRPRALATAARAAEEPEQLSGREAMMAGALKFRGPRAL